MEVLGKLRGHVQYVPLPPASDDEETSLSASEEKFFAARSSHGHPPASRWARYWLYVLVLVCISLCCGLVWSLDMLSKVGHQLEKAIGDLQQCTAHMHVEKSPHAGLLPERTESIYEKTVYGNVDDLAATDSYWDAINIDAGNIALPDEYIEAMGLPVAQRFPWDESKGIYLLNSHHHLHCLKQIYTSLREYREGRPQSRGLWHQIHCLDALRRQVICNADDTPRASTHEHAPNTGVDQPRMCRSWSKLEAWASNYTACFSYIPLTGSMTNLDRFKHCPPGSPYHAKIKEYEEEQARSEE